MSTEESLYGTDACMARTLPTGQSLGKLSTCPSGHDSNKQLHMIYTYTYNYIFV